MSDRNVPFDRGTGDSRPLSEFVRSVITDLQEIVRAEIRLALSELKSQAHHSRKAAVFLAAAGLLAFLATECFLITCIAALAIVLPLWLAALIIGVMLAVVAGGAFTLGRLALDKVDPLPQRTLETLKDNLDWAKDRLS